MATCYECIRSLTIHQRRLLLSSFYVLLCCCESKENIASIYTEVIVAGKCKVLNFVAMDQIQYIFKILNFIFKQ